MVSEVIESTMEVGAISASKKCKLLPKVERKGMKAIIFVDNSEDALNNSTCSSLTDDSDLSIENDHTSNAICSRDNDAILNTIFHENRSKRKDCKSVSYAQLFFDPETQVLVTLMEVNFFSSSSRSLESKSAGSEQSFSLQYPKDDGSSQNVSLPCQEGSRFQDQTMVTEYSSIFTDIEREGQGNVPFESKRQRFFDEPIVFSHSRTTQLWLEENDLNLYLLQDSADPWNDRIRKPAGCTETLKMLLKLRACISLSSIRQVGESKWKIQTNVKGMERGMTVQSMTYSQLRDD
ncbi:hypothetical protein IV203_021021 [Nitzschia inconspicua]|uniref:Uncharacterized protein n=1 Tax=Nitzschia inconspicua TaxID=303405 RepID=A0A9K3PDU9_9STRA|nr:hypothetical protein IV203_021021 [Nitzschia inconspicua]